MSTPEEKARKRMRLKVKAKKDKKVQKVRTKVTREDHKKELDVTKLTHAQLVKLINDKAEDE